MTKAFSSETTTPNPGTQTSRGDQQTARGQQRSAEKSEDESITDRPETRSSQPDHHSRQSSQPARRVIRVSKINTSTIDPNTTNTQSKAGTSYFTKSNVAKAAVIGLGVAAAGYGAHTYLSVHPEVLPGIGNQLASSVGTAKDYASTGLSHATSGLSTAKDYTSNLGQSAWSNIDGYTGISQIQPSNWVSKGVSGVQSGASAVSKMSVVSWVPSLASTAAGFLGKQEPEPSVATQFVAPEPVPQPSRSGWFSRGEGYKHGRDWSGRG